MPWCEECAKYWTPSAMNEDGTCPSCGRTVEAQQPITAKNIDLKQLAAGADGNPDDAKAPWHFKLLMVLLVAYLGWRIVQLFV
jgi:hypothetical protein